MEIRSVREKKKSHRFHRETFFSISFYLLPYFHSLFVSFPPSFLPPFIPDSRVRRIIANDLRHVLSSNFLPTRVSSFFLFFLPFFFSLSFFFPLSSYNRDNYVTTCRVVVEVWPFPSDIFSAIKCSTQSITICRLCICYSVNQIPRAKATVNHERL